MNRLFYFIATFILACNSQKQILNKPLNYECKKTDGSTDYIQLNFDKVSGIYLGSANDEKKGRFYYRSHFKPKIDDTSIVFYLETLQVSRTPFTTDSEDTELISDSTQTSFLLNFSHTCSGKLAGDSLILNIVTIASDSNVERMVFVKQ
jgi:hypothetical protein